MRTVLNWAGATTGTYIYDAYGRQQCTSGSSPICDNTIPFGYTGQYQDAESGLLYLRARYYDPATQEFISRDPAAQPGGVSAYSYANGNPVNYADPRGLWPGPESEQLPPSGGGLVGPWPVEGGPQAWAGPEAGPASPANAGETRYPQGAHPASEGRNYELPFAMYLKPEDYSKSDKVHFNRANAALDEAMVADRAFAAEMEKLIPGVGESVAARGRRHVPDGWTWHHAYEPGRLELVRASEHWGQFWAEMHPGGIGGYARWASPAGAPLRHRAR